ncbi:MAG: hypothetical protein HYW01_14285 [Deltaproteobacteria bacterium]|nr:hypothetical protein [Deltaproteobacteria bacterium]
MQKRLIKTQTIRGKNIEPFIVLAIVLLIACGGGKEKEIPGMNIAGIRTTISRILISPLAFDSAIVAVEGLAHDVKKETVNGEKTEKTFFKLADLRGNFINVSILGKWEIVENDHLIVGGIYRRTTNEIEAEQVEKIQLEEEK